MAHMIWGMQRPSSTGQNMAMTVIDLCTDLPHSTHPSPMCSTCPPGAYPDPCEERHHPD
jgi:hypothetical protein